MKINSLVTIVSGLLIGLILYYPSLGFDFAWLDQFEIVDRGLIAGSFSEWLNMLMMNDGNYESYHRPMYNLVHSLDYALWGNEAMGFHLSNLMFHLANVALLGLLFKKLNVNPLIAAAVLLLWTVLPLNAAVVSLIHAKGDLISTFFILAAFNFLLSKPSWSLVLFSMSMCLALLSKEVAIAGLVLSTIWLWKNNRLFRMPEGLAVVIPLLLFLYVRLFLVQTEGIAPDWSRLMTFPLVYASYFFESMPSLRLTISDATWAISARETMDVVLYVSMFVGSVLLQVVMWRRLPQTRAFILIFNIFLLPVSQIFPTLHFRADRFLYVASIGWLGMFWVALFNVLQEKRILMAITGIILVFFIFKTRNYLSVFENDKSLFTYTHSIDEDCREANSFLGQLAMQNQDYQTAQTYFSKALNGNPSLFSFVDRSGVKANLGTIAMRNGQYEEALSLFESIEGGTEKYPAMNLNIAICHKMALRPRKAYEYLVIYQKQFPDELKGMEKMAEVYIDLGRKQKAIDELNKILKLYPEHSNRKVMNDAIELLRQSDY
jgi:tetratricopeptide (TPR) repeat protein